METATSALVGTTIDAGRLKIVALLGSGGFGAVFRALELSTQREFAVKCMPCAARTSSHFALQVSELNVHLRVQDHPHVVGFHRVLEEGSWRFFVLDLCKGGDLFNAVIAGKFHRRDELVRGVFVQLLDAVSYCHDVGVYHRDLKPENVLLSEDGAQAYLADFGLATEEAMCGQFRVGSKLFMSPECLHEDLKLTQYSSPHNDIWALGLILFTMITRQVPWEAATAADQWFAWFLEHPHLFGQANHIPAPVGALLLRILTFDPYARISLAELREEILKVETFFSEEDHEEEDEVVLVAVEEKVREKEAGDVAVAVAHFALEDSDEDSDMGSHPLAAVIVSWPMPPQFISPPPHPHILSSSSSSALSSLLVTPETHPVHLPADVIDLGAAMGALIVRPHAEVEKALPARPAQAHVLEA
ncbi:kinase-like domain-containing protein [Amylostereum chailletii]|nr:kinase-like domain-containing protein [Amylostereum chailletii]